MGYRVDYWPIRKVRRVRERISGRAAVLGLVLMALLLSLCWPQGREVVGSLLFSGDKAVTAAALEDMVADLSQGEAFSQAAKEFCRRVIVAADSG